MLDDRIEFFLLEEATPGIGLCETGDVQAVGRLPRFHCIRESPPQDGGFSVDLAVAGLLGLPAGNERTSSGEISFAFQPRKDFARCRARRRTLSSDVRLFAL